MHAILTSFKFEIIIKSLRCNFMLTLDAHFEHAPKVHGFERTGVVHGTFSVNARFERQNQSRDRRSTRVATLSPCKSRSATHSNPEIRI